MKEGKCFICGKEKDDLGSEYFIRVSRRGGKGGREYCSGCFRKQKKVCNELYDWWTWFILNREEETEKVELRLRQHDLTKHYDIVDWQNCGWITPAFFDFLGETA